MEKRVPLPRQWPHISIKLVVTVLALLVIAAAGLIYWSRISAGPSAPAWVTARVQTGDIVNSVSGTGPIAASSAVPLNFKNSGKVASIDVHVGDAVKAGQVLAKMDTSDLTSQLNQAQANLANAQAAYNKLAQGPLPTDIQVAQAGVDTAKNQLANAQKNVAAVQAQIDANLASDKVTVQNAQLALGDAQRTQAALPAVIAQQIAQAKNNLYSAQLTRDATCGRGSGGQCDAANATVNAQQSALDQANASAVQQTAQQQAAVDQAQSALNAANATLQNDQAKNKASLVTAQTSVQSAQDGVSTALANLAKAQAPATQADLDAASAQIAAQQANVQLAQNNLGYAVLTAPFDATVTAINGAVGQWLAGGATTGAAASTASGAAAASTTASTDFMDLTQLSGLQVTAEINEADIAKVKVGQAVNFTVDAYPGRTFTGKVAIIQPLGQNVQNVVSYTVTSTIDPTNATLLPGMTASESIIISKAQGVLEVPMAALTYARAVLSAQSASAQPSASASPRPSAAPGQAPGAAAQAPGAAAQRQPAGAQRGAGTVEQQPGGPGVLLLLKEGKAVQTPVQFGVSDGRFVQVVSGVSEGDEVITSGPAPSAAVSAQRGGGGMFGFPFGGPR